MNLYAQDKLNSIKDIGLCIQFLIRSRFNKKTKLIYTHGKFKSLYLSFYKQRTYQFYVQDKNGYYLVYLLRDEKVVRREAIRRNETINDFYKKMNMFFKMI